MLHSLPCSEVLGVVTETGFNLSWEEGVCTGLAAFQSVTRVPCSASVFPVHFAVFPLPLGPEYNFFLQEYGFPICKQW